MGKKGKGSPLYIGIVIGALLVALIAVVSMIGLQMVSLTRRVESRNETLMSSVRDNTASLELLKQSMLLLARDSNEVRSEVNLPAHDYPVFHSKPHARTAYSDPRTAFLDGLDVLLRASDREQSRKQIDELVANALFSRIERTNGLSARRSEDDRVILTKNSHDYFMLTFDPVSRRLRISDFLGKVLTAARLDGRVEEFITGRSALLDRHFASLSAALQTLSNAATRPSIRSILKENELAITAPVPVDGGYRLFVRRAGATLLTATLDDRSLAVSESDRRYGDVAAFLAAFPEELRRLDPAAAADRRVAAARHSIESLRADKTFMLALSARKISFAAKPRQDIDYYYYDFSDANGVLIGSFAVQKKLGTIYLMDGNGLTIRGLTAAGSAGDAAPSEAHGGSAKKKLIDTSEPAAGLPIAPSIDARHTADFLLCGAHQKETDSVIVVHADRVRGRITFISIPRDLYYKGRKMNAVYELYGPRELAREISEITGLDIRNYIVIDMYAFVDVINILGGIDLYLREPVVDPTYRVWDGGGWSTLSYAAGMHHLDGIATLRIARSRHTSSDFIRAYRQQDILAAIRHRIAQLDPVDVSKLYHLAGVFFRYVDTDFTPAELASLFLTYRKIPISGHYVIDTANVLYQTYTNIYYLGDGGKQLSDGLDKGAWILLPKGDDWNVIRHYVSRILGGEAS